MADSGLIPVDRTGEWSDALARCGPYDSYHRSGYHLVAKAQGEGEPYLFFFEDEGRCAALPFLLRPVAEVPGLEDCEDCDATSAYGYPGLVTSVDRRDVAADSFRTRFQAALTEALHRLNVVALFCRQNPLIGSSWMFDRIARVSAHGSTVAIDLTRPEEEQFRAMRKGHRSDIRSARRKGMIVTEDSQFRRIDTFRRIYYETMDRAQAAGSYYFPGRYFAGLKQHLQDRVRLLFSEQDGKVISGGMFLLAGNIVQYHLGGTATECLKCRGGMKVVLDEMRSWAAQNGFSWLHLGGGLGARKDSLFDFKAGFSKTCRTFETVRMIVAPNAYHQLVRRRDRGAPSAGDAPSGEDYFPKYRRPAIRRAA